MNFGGFQAHIGNRDVQENSTSNFSKEGPGYQTNKNLRQKKRTGQRTNSNGSCEMSVMYSSSTLTKTSIRLTEVVYAHFDVDSDLFT